MLQSVYPCFGLHSMWSVDIHACVESFRARTSFSCPVFRGVLRMHDGFVMVIISLSDLPSHKERHGERRPRTVRLRPLVLKPEAGQTALNTGFSFPANAVILLWQDKSKSIEPLNETQARVRTYPEHSVLARISANKGPTDQTDDVEVNSWSVFL